MISNGLFYLIVIFISALGLDSASQSNSIKNSAHNNIAENTEKIENSNDILCICKRKQSTRWLRAYKLNDGKCSAVYSKDGYLQIIGSGSYFSSCEAVLLNVKKNLEEGGFSCEIVQKHSILQLE